ncbi:TPA: ead/Ea22-like family protein [Salmonella enterica]|uniref:Ead/Ea22-like family protein n=1 Tax=Salmonella enterica TaxID=28901 RepID=A0A743SSF4_SALER|nr:ead/Ea22-like family protein [Salmonella enterica]
MTIDKQALREVATEATQGGWYVDYDFDVCHESGALIAETHGDNLVQSAKFIAAANPATVLALLDENIQLQREKDAIEAVALALRDDMRQAREQLEEAEKLNAAQQGSLDYRKFLLLSAYEVQRDFAEALGCAGDNESIMEAIDDMKQRIAELEAKLETADKLQDSAFRDGLKAGFSYGQTDDQSGYEQCLKSYSSRGKDNG